MWFFLHLSDRLAYEYGGSALGGFIIIVSFLRRERSRDDYFADAYLYLPGGIRPLRYREGNLFLSQYYFLGSRLLGQLRWLHIWPWF